MIKNRIASLDLLRFISVILVMYGHFVLVGGGATVIPGVIADGIALPLIDNSIWGFWKFETLLVETFHTQSAVLGVTLFFMITGYLIPTMRERYSRKAFLVNRCLRIFPVLIAGTLIIGLFLHFAQGIDFPLSSYLGSWTLSYLIFGVVPVSGVLWTLIVEVIFYVIALLMGCFTVYRLMLLYTVLIAVILVFRTFPDYAHFALAATQAKFLLMILVGSAVFLAEREEKWRWKLALIGASLMISYMGFQLFNLAQLDTSTYTNFGTSLLALGLFLTIQKTSSAGWITRLPIIISWLADLAYPIYIVHVAFGFATMALVRCLSPNPYIMLAAAMVISIVVSAALHLCVELPGIALGREIAKRIDGATRI